jgi:hypothetical protein
VNLTFELNFHKNGLTSVNITHIKGRKIPPVSVYVSHYQSKAEAVHSALQSGLLSNITHAIMKNGS